MFQIKPDPKENWHQHCARQAKEASVEASKATQLEHDLALAFGCIDPDRCNGHVTPEGRCSECIIRSMEVVKEMHMKGYRFNK